MGRIAKIARRTFLVGTAAVAGGVAFGYYAYKKPYPNPLLDDLEEGEVSLNPFLIIDQKGVTLIAPRADVGQGAHSVQAALLAEELEIAWQDIQVESAPPGPAYYNDALGSEAVPFAATDESFMANRARAIGGAAMKLMKLQMTGGSSTVPDSYEKLRKAGAVARETLLLAAEQQTGINKAELKAKNGAVVLPDGSQLTYSELALTASQVDAPDDVVLKPESEWKYLGKPTQRI